MAKPTEPRVLTADVRAIIRRVVSPDDPDLGEAVKVFAGRAELSTRTVYRVLSGRAGDATHPPSISLTVADKLVTAAGLHLQECRVLLEDGRVVDYLDAP